MGNLTDGVLFLPEVSVSTVNPRSYAAVKVQNTNVHEHLPSGQCKEPREDVHHVETAAWGMGDSDRRQGL